MADRTFSSDFLIKTGKTIYDRMCSKERFSLFEVYEDFKKRVIGNDDYLLNSLCCYSWHSEIKIGEAVWMHEIIKMINQGSLYMAILPVDNWAYADKNITQNIANIQKRYSEITIALEGKRNSDGFFFTENELTFGKVYNGDENMPDEIEEKKFPAFGGVVEFGYTHISKSASTLLMGTPLLRVPYEINGYNPFATIFINTNPVNVELCA